MNTSDADRFAGMLAAVAELYDRRLPDALIVMFFRALEAYDLDVVEAAFNKFLQSSESKIGFPKPANIRDIIEGSDAERESLAWITLETAVRKIGPYSSVLIEDGALAQAITMTFGAWWKAALARYEHGDGYGWSGKRKDFAAMYRIARRNGNVQPMIMAGQCEHENRLSGWFQTHAHYGTIRLDGRIESRYLAVDQHTGYPALSARQALELPSADVDRRALPAHDYESAPPKTEAEFRAELKQFAKRRSIDVPREIAFDENQVIDRIAELRQQSRVINADAPSHRKTGESVHDAPGGESDRRGDRTPNPGGGTPGTGSGVLLRDTDRPELARGSGVAGVPDPVRARGKRVRKRDSLRAGKLDNKARKR